MEEAQEKDMDAVASFKSGKSLSITGRQDNICSRLQMINLLASSNRYGYIFYATESDGLVIIPSKYIDQKSSYLTKSSDDDDDNDDENQNLEKNSIIHRSYMPTQMINKNSLIIPHWLSLNADDSILAIVLSQLDTQSWYIIFYDVVKLIQSPDSTPIGTPINLSNNSIGDTIIHFTWNPAIPNMFAYIDGNGSVSTFEIDQNSKQLKSLGKCDANDDNSSICWSPKGKQIVVVTYDGVLELYEPNMKLKKKYPSAIPANSLLPPCISVLWFSTHQFLLGFSENSPDENTNDNSFFHIMVTYDKDQLVRTQIYNDLFFDAYETPININSQYFYVRMNESKIIVCGLTKSLKIHVLGSDELNQFSCNC
ncbi:unnamed protein product [Rotaria sordida]|uniref:Nucleoporin Nup159/Nup146 N-terminal domain-containing protein n=1 Tax=Rotaria sordida TaxID=392033 RepID=A0A815CNE7_9BILA|nr:unnamed protein product [Rotaria sordida]CAF3914984.1 unnamed protein product [Rotaria sordida]